MNNKFIFRVSNKVVKFGETLKFSYNQKQDLKTMLKIVGFVWLVCLCIKLIGALI